MRKSDRDQVTVVAAGITMAEAQKAADKLQKENIHIRIIDPFTIKPIDRVCVLDAAHSTGGRVLVVEDHYAAGQYMPFNLFNSLDLINSFYRAKMSLSVLNR